MIVKLNTAHDADPVFIQGLPNSKDDMTHIDMWANVGALLFTIFTQMGRGTMSAFVDAMANLTDELKKAKDQEEINGIIGRFIVIMYSLGQSKIEDVQLTDEFKAAISDPENQKVILSQLTELRKRDQE